VLPKTVPQTIDMYIDQTNVGKKEFTQLGRQEITFELGNEERFLHEIAVKCRNVVKAGNGDERLLGVKIVEVVFE
jgi:hypothetical protein